MTEARSITPQSLIAVRFHGGFLDKRVVRSGDALTGSIADYWNAERFYKATAGQVGAFMAGIAPEGIASMKVPSPTAATVDLNHRYRVVKCQDINGTLVIDADYEYVP